jgi:hypothetical protein
MIGKGLQSPASLNPVLQNHQSDFLCKGRYIAINIWTG